MAKNRLNAGVDGVALLRRVFPMLAPLATAGTERDKANRNRVPVTKNMLDVGEVPHDPQIRFDDLAEHPTPHLAVREIILVLDWWRDRLRLPKLFPKSET